MGRRGGDVEATRAALDVQYPDNPLPYVFRTGERLHLFAPSNPRKAYIHTIDTGTPS